MKKISIVIPAHNEEDRIGETLDDYLKYFFSLKKKKVLDFEIIIVLNACKDNTRKVIEKRRAKELRIIEFERAGKGFAVTEGFKDALKRKNNEIIGFVDADGATPPEAYYDLVKNMGSSDGAIANRWDATSVIMTPQPFLRKLTSRTFNFVVRSLFLIPHRDTQCGAKIFRRELLEKIVSKVGSSEWSFDVDLLFYARREGAKIKSVPTIWEDKKGSKLNLKKTPLRMFVSVIRLRMLHSPFRTLARAYSKVVPKALKIRYIMMK